MQAPRLRTCLLLRWIRSFGSSSSLPRRSTLPLQRRWPRSRCSGSACERVSWLKTLLRAIDRAIPFPLIFELTWSGKQKAVAAFKRPSEADSNKWVVSEYFGTEWVPENAPRLPLPVALNLGALYEQLLTQIMSPSNAAEHSTKLGGFGEAPQAAFMHESAVPPEPIAARVARMEAIRVKIREIERIKGRFDREKQFNSA